MKPTRKEAQAIDRMELKELAGEQALGCTQRPLETSNGDDEDDEDEEETKKKEQDNEEDDEDEEEEEESSWNIQRLHA